MTLRVLVRPEAKCDIRDARKRYRKISPGLAADFVAAAETAIRAATEHPVAYQVVDRSFRRVLLRRFPYSLFFEVVKDRLVVVAVASGPRSRASAKPLIPNTGISPHFRPFHLPINVPI